MHQGVAFRDERGFNVAGTLANLERNYRQADADGYRKLSLQEKALVSAVFL